ncbi:MAG: anti-sigma factor [Bacteroidia bacterium]
MDPKEYIESGMLESYVLGNCTPDEMQEAECMKRVFPEVRRELLSIQASFESYVMANKVQPPAALKSKIFEVIANEEKQVKSGGAKVIPIYESSKNKNTGLKLLIAAAFGLLVISAYISYNFSVRNNQLNEHVAELTSQQEAVQKHFDDLNNKFENTQKQFAVVSNPNSVPVPMKGLKISPSSLATVFWNKQSKEVYIAVSSLPKPPEGKQYQLWALKDGQAIDAGVFDVGDSVGIQKMKIIENAQGFAVTLEKKGGVPKAEGEMYVLGNI